jgi:hypothetical protein
MSLERALPREFPESLIVAAHRSTHYGYSKAAALSVTATAFSPAIASDPTGNATQLLTG